MRIFNPFSPHICEFGTGGFAVRKLSLAGWLCLSIDEDFWWFTQLGIARCCMYVNPVDAAERIATYNKRKPFWKLYAY